jgi:hypothetical protein
MTIREIKSDLPEYAALSAAHGSVFNQPAWLKMYGEAIVLNGIFNLNNELIGAYHVFTGRKMGLKYAIVPPYTPSNGLFFVNPAENLPNRITFGKSVHKAIADHFRRSSGVLTISAFPPAVTDTQQYYWSGFKVIPNYTYRLSLSPSEEKLFENMTTEKRKSVRRAEKDKVEITLCTDHQVIKDLVLKTFNRKDKKINATYVDRILFEYASQQNSFAFVASVEGRPSACTFCVHDQNTSYYLFGGYDNHNKHHGAGVSCMWQSILHARKLGLGIFDFEGSMLPEVEKYFREFGVELVPYYTIQRARLPIEFLLKLKMRNRF